MKAANRIAVVGTPQGPSRKTLQGVDQVRLVLEDVISEEGISEKGKEFNEAFLHDLRALVTQRLNGSPVALVPEEIAERPDDIPALYINVRLYRTEFIDAQSGDKALSLGVVTELFQGARLVRLPELSLNLPTWSVVFFTVVRLSEWRNSLIGIVESQIEEFLTAVRPAA